MAGDDCEIQGRYLDTTHLLFPRVCHPLKTKSCVDANVAVTDGTAACHQRQQCSHYDNSQFLMSTPQNCVMMVVVGMKNKRWTIECLYIYVESCHIPQIWYCMIYLFVLYLLITSLLFYSSTSFDHVCDPIKSNYHRVMKLIKQSSVLQLWFTILQVFKNKLISRGLCYTNIHRN